MFGCVLFFFFFYKTDTGVLSVYSTGAPLNVVHITNGSPPTCSASATPPPTTDTGPGKVMGILLLYIIPLYCLLRLVTVVVVGLVEWKNILRFSLCWILHYMHIFAHGMQSTEYITLQPSIVWYGMVWYIKCVHIYIYMYILHAYGVYICFLCLVADEYLQITFSEQ